MKLKARRARPVTDSDIRYLSVWNPQIGLHYDVHEENSDADPRVLEAFWQIMEAEYESDICKGKAEGELKEQVNAKARFVSKRVIKVLRYGNSVTFRNLHLYYFYPSGKKKVKVVSLKDSLVSYITYKELFYYFRRMKNDSGVRGDL